MITLQASGCSNFLNDLQHKGFYILRTVAGRANVLPATVRIQLNEYFMKDFEKQAWEVTS